MTELIEKAENYAAEKTNEVMVRAIAQAYADGYRDGYKDRGEEILVDLRDNKTEYVDLGLPSGTLWATDYEKENDEIMYFSFDKVNSLNIPSMAQWKELYELCDWECITSYGKTDKNIKEVLCAGPNGNILRFATTGMQKFGGTIDREYIYFWLGENEEIKEKNCVRIIRSFQARVDSKRYYDTSYETIRMFAGYKLPVRLVKKINY